MLRLAALFVLVASMAATPWASADPADYMGERMPYDAFDALPKTQIEVGGGKLDVAFAPGTFALPKEKLLGWIKKSAAAVCGLLWPLPCRRGSCPDRANTGARGAPRHGLRLSRAGTSPCGWQRQHRGRSSSRLEGGARDDPPCVA